MNNLNKTNSPLVYPRLMHRDHCFRKAALFIGTAVFLFVGVYLNVKYAQSLSDVTGMLFMAFMYAGLPCGIVHLFPSIPKFSTMSFRIKLYRTINKAVRFLVLIPAIGWIGCAMIAAGAYLFLPMLIGFFTGPIYFVIDAIRLIKKKTLIYDYEVPKYAEQP